MKTVLKLSIIILLFSCNKKEDPKDMKRKQTMTNQKATKVEMEPKVEYDK